MPGYFERLAAVTLGKADAIRPASSSVFRVVEIDEDVEIGEVTEVGEDNGEVRFPALPPAGPAPEADGG